MNKPAHIRILAGQLNRHAGSHVYNRELAVRLVKRGYRVSMICFEKDSSIANLCQLYEIPRAGTSTKGLWRIAPLLDYVTCSRGLRQLPLDPPDVVISGEHLFMRAHAQRFSRVPFIYIPHSLTVRHEIQTYPWALLMKQTTILLYEWLQRWGVNHSQRTLRFTKSACEALVKRYGKQIRPRFFVNPHGIELPSLDQEQLKRTKSGRELNLLSVGQLIRRKRIDIALQALSKARQTRWKYDIVGDGYLKPQLEKMTEELALSDRVRFWGFQPEPWNWYRNADLVLFPSESENFPLTLLEAMSYGIPLLTIRSDGKQFENCNHEIIRHKENGFLAESIEDFGDQLQTLLRHPEFLTEAGYQARETMKLHYTWEQHFDRYDLLFQELLGNKGKNQTDTELKRQSSSH